MRHCIEHIIIKTHDKLWVLAHITDIVVDSLINIIADSSDEQVLTEIWKGFN